MVTELPAPFHHIFVYLYVTNLLSMTVVFCMFLLIVEASCCSCCCRYQWHPQKMPRCPRLQRHLSHYDVPNHLHFHHPGGGISVCFR